MLRRTTLTRLAVPAASALVLGLAVPALHAAAAPTTAEECVQAGNVWVHVEYDETVTGGCATEFGTALEALTSTFDASISEDGWVETVDNRVPANEEWWSLYLLSPSEDGTYPDEWAFATVGIAQQEMAASDVLALKLQPDYSSTDVPANPVAGVTLVDDATPEPTPTPPSPEPTSSEAPTASPEPTAAPTTEVPVATPTPAPTTEAPVEQAPTPTVAPTRPGLPKTGN